MRRILWFRRDLRVEDNRLLSFEGEVFPIFIFDTNILEKLPKEDKRLSIIWDGVLRLKRDLMGVGLDLKIFYGKPLEIFASLPLHDFDEVVASGDYDAYAKERDLGVSQMIHFRYLNDTYIFKPKEVMKKDGSPYLVFTPFYKAALPLLKQKDLSSAPKASQTLYKYDYANTITLESMGFVYQAVAFAYTPQEQEAFFVRMSGYETQRDYLSENGTSHLSVALRFGFVSIRSLVARALENPYGEAFVRQLIFRDFYAYLLFHFPSLATQNYKGSFNGIEDRAKFERFCEARTGVPIVDAGVRELLESGNMHNRVRMIVASFFTKDLLLPWQWGEAFFAKHLLDYDAASNILSWQWSAGTGIDPQPYFRVFNPYLQSKKFDKDGVYMKKYLKELAHLEVKMLHDERFLFKQTLISYPKPMVVHKEAAAVAIEKFKQGVCHGV